MNKKSLKNKLDSLNINPNFYSLNGEIIEDACIFMENYDKWIVFYFERGQRFFEKTFKDESVACKYLLELVKKHSGIA